MSYRELRNFTEIMRALGYTRLISVENFRTPNFELVADILFWLVHRYDPNLQLPYKTYENEQERVEFLKLTAEVMYSKARIKLNTKKLYNADGYAVKELLKISSLLYESLKTNFSEKDLIDNNQEINLNNKLNDLKNTRSLASEITSIGVIIYDLLGSEVELRESRQQSISKNYNNDEIEKNIRKTVENIQEQVTTLIQRVENLSSDEMNLETKIEKKRIDLERNRNRLKSLQGVRPAFMDEYERLEIELQKQYILYLERFRNLEYLENELEIIHRTEQESFEESQKYLKRIQGKQQEGNNNNNNNNNQNISKRIDSPDSGDAFEQDTEAFASNLDNNGEFENDPNEDEFGLDEQENDSEMELQSEEEGEEEGEGSELEMERRNNISEGEGVEEEDDNEF